MTFPVKLIPQANPMTNTTEPNTTEPNTTEHMTDPREIHRRAMAQTEAIVGEGGDALARPARADDVPGEGWLDAYRAAAQRARAAWADDVKLDVMVEVPWGKIPGRFAVAGYIQEILTHGWDLAKATGQPTEGDPELAFFALAGAKRILPPEARGDDVPFAPVVPVPPDAAPYAQLAAWLGRQP